MWNGNVQRPVWRPTTLQGYGINRTDVDKKKIPPFKQILTSFIESFINVWVLA